MRIGLRYPGDRAMRDRSATAESRSTALFDALSYVRSSSTAATAAWVFGVSSKK